MNLKFLKSIKTKILLMIFVLVIITAYILSGVTIYQFKNNMLSLIESDVRAVTEEASAHISNVLKNYMMTLKSYTYAEEIKSMDYDLQRAFLDQLKSPFFQGITIIDSDGMGRYDGKAVYLGDRDYFQEAQHGRDFISGIIDSRFLNENVIIFSTPIYQGETVVGVLTGRILSSDFDLIIKEKDLAGKGYSYIMDESGQFVSYTVDELLRQDYTIHDMKDEYDFLDSFYTFYLDSITATSGYGSYDVDGSKIIAGYHIIEETDWILYCAAEESILLEDLNRTLQIYMITATIIFIMSIIAASELSKRITKPLITLSQTFESISEGDFSIRSKLKRNDEIGVLSDGFNKLMNKVNALTFFDETTGFPNVLALSNHLNIHDKTNLMRMFSIGFIEFKRINEQYGFEVGDELLKAIGLRLNQIISVDERVFKGKGDMFFLTLNANDMVETRIHKINSLLEKPFRIQHYNIILNYHIGVLDFTNEYHVNEALQNVNLAYMFARKNQLLYKEYSLELLKSSQDEIQFEHDLIDAIEKSAFYMVYQPIIDLKTNQIADVEALIRWEDDKRGFVSPEYFISKAESMNKIQQIDYWVINQVCRMIESSSNKLAVSINISAKSFEAHDFLDHIIEITNNYHVLPSKIQLELTERVIIKDIETSIKKMDAIKRAGFKIALDDFGIGYSSLSYLVQLPIDVVKIDRSFIMHMHDNLESKSIVDAIISMCHTIGIDVVAEGIESFEDEDYLKSRFCNYGQGYYFDKPLKFDDLKKKYLS